MAKNEVYVTTDLQDERLWRRELRLTDLHLINNDDITAMNGLKVRTRYRAPLVGIANIEKTDSGVKIELAEEVRAITPGQSAVFYAEDRCLGGGIVV